MHHHPHQQHHPNTFKHQCVDPSPLSVKLTKHVYAPRASDKKGDNLVTKMSSASWREIDLK